MRIILLIILVTLTGCTRFSEVDCIMYGVEPNWHTQRIRSAQGVSQRVINEECGDRRKALSYKTAGCMKPVKVGVVDLYWIKGDSCVKTHEFCHALHGYEHTRAYLKRVENGANNPACPFGN